MIASHSPTSYPIHLVLIFLASIPTFRATAVDTTNTIDKIWSPPPPGPWQPIGSKPSCGKTTLVYRPKTYIDWFERPSHLHHSSLPLDRVVLPATGELLLQHSDTIFFGHANRTATACSPFSIWSNYLLQPAATAISWYDPTAWTTRHQQRPNRAVPHVNRVPCECDQVSLLARPLAIRLADDDDVLVRSITVDGTSTGTLESLLASPQGGRMFTSTGQPAVRSSRCGGGASQQACGCHTAERYAYVEQAVCAEVRCPRQASCLRPIRVAGMCCEVCGAEFVLQSRMTECPHGESVDTVEATREKVRRAIAGLDGGRFEELVDYDVSLWPRMKHESGGFSTEVDYSVRLTIVDRSEEYRGDSAELARQLRELPSIHSLFNHFNSAGEPFSPDQRAPLTTIVFGSLLLVLAAYAVAYAHYEKGWLGGVERFGSRVRGILGAPQAFRRFDNVSLAGGLAETPAAVRQQLRSLEVSVAAADSTTETSEAIAAASPAVNIEFTAGAATTGVRTSAADTKMTAFDNPLFGAQSVAVGMVDAVIGSEDAANKRSGAIEGGDVNLVDVDLDSSETNI